MLSEIAFATDEELARYEHEIVNLVERTGVSLASVRDALLDELLEEAVGDGVDTAKVIDDGGDRALALRRYATRKALRIIWSDLSQGREGTSAEAKATLATAAESRSRNAFRAAGWPVDTTGDDEVTDEDETPTTGRVQFELTR